MYVTRGMEVGSSICVQVRTGGEGYHASCVHKHLHYPFSCFCLMVSCFICRNVTLPSFKKGMFVRNGYFSPMRSISVVMKQAFFTLNWFSEPKLAKTLLILIKQNFTYTLYFSVTLYFEKILCSVARRFI